jgi:hypothetical protein
VPRTETELHVDLREVGRGFLDVSFSLQLGNFVLEPRDLELLRSIRFWLGKACCGSSRTSSPNRATATYAHPSPVTPYIGHASILDQAHSLA